MITIRKGEKADLEAVYELICELAEYEKAKHEVENTVAQLEQDGFGDKPLFGFFVAQDDEQIIGFALYYYRYSTWKGKTLYLEDIYVKPNYRRQKIGDSLFKALIRKAKQEDCARLSWQVLDWNHSAIAFYKGIGAKFDTEWMNAYLTKQQLED